MKKILYTMILGAAVLLTSCNREEANLFDLSAAERMAALQEAVIANLTGESAGWELRYFPTEESAGYAFLMKSTIHAPTSLVPYLAPPST